MIVATDELTRTFAALADPTRRAILQRLADGEASVNELAKPFPITVQAVSRHLKGLEDAGLITRTRPPPSRSKRRPPGSSDTVVSGKVASTDSASGSTKMAEQGITITRVFEAPRERVWQGGGAAESFVPSVTCRRRAAPPS